MPSDLLPSGMRWRRAGLISTAAGIQKVQRLMKRETFFLPIALFQSHHIRCHVQAARCISESTPQVWIFSGYADNCNALGPIGSGL
jgi:hypothetical protein